METTNQIAPGAGAAAATSQGQAGASPQAQGGATPAGQQAAAAGTPAPAPQQADLAAAEARGRAAALKALGFEGEADANKFIGDARGALEASKSEEQKRAERIAALEKEAADAKGLRDLVKAQSDAEFGGLDDGMKAFVQKMAGDDPAKRLEMIVSAKASGLIKAASAPAQPAQSKATTVTPPAATGAATSKHPRDMTPQEFSAYQRQKLAERAAGRN
jgi:hypothetical protein